MIKWIATEKDLSVFVRYIVSEIRSHGDIQINYVRSNANLANVASRESSVNKLKANQL